MTIDNTPLRLQVGQSNLGVTVLTINTQSITISNEGVKQTLRLSSAEPSKSQSTDAPLVKANESPHYDYSTQVEASPRGC